MSSYILRNGSAAALLKKYLPRQLGNNSLNVNTHRVKKKRIKIILKTQL